MLKDSNFSNLRMNCEEGFIEKYYTKKEIFEYFDVKTNSEISNSLQLQAGHMFFEKINSWNILEITKVCWIKIQI